MMGQRRFGRAHVLYSTLALCSLLLAPVSPSSALDCNNNGKDDACDLNCSNPNGPCDLSTCGTSQDCNGNGIPDECDVDPLDPDGNGQVSPDCGGDGVPDECDPDCNNNGIPDDCDVDPLDPDGNGQASLDCNANGIPDECELAGNDCNASGIPDDCELVGSDCNADGIHNDCDPDCNGNGKSDTCEILDGTTSDCNANGFPDDCDILSFTQRAKLTAADGAAGEFFGESVSISGDTAIIGARRDDHAGTFSGAAYVFVRSGGVWTQQAKLTAADAAAFDNFGFFVSISGDTAVIGTIWDDDAGNQSGSAYVFVRSGGVWTQQAKLTAADAATSDEFGISVSISGDTAVIGAMRDDDAGDQSGSAYVFVRTGGIWAQQAKLTAADAAAGDRFGSSVSISSNTAVIGAFEDDDVGGGSGSAYVFVRSGGVWTQQAKLTAADAAAGDVFGRSVSISGDTAVIGANGDDDACPANNSCNSGSAYVFVRSGGVWTQQAKLTAADAALFDFFGNSVSISGETAIIGSILDDDACPTNINCSSGSAYVFVRTGGIWAQQAKLTAADAAAGDRFGSSVSISSNTAVIGAFKDDDAGSDSGSAYVFTLTSDCNANGIPDECEFVGSDCNADGIPDECEIDSGSAAPGGPFFCTMNCAPDFNNNGVPDLCDSVGDFDGDGVITPADVQIFVDTLVSGGATPLGDFNGDGTFDGLDIDGLVQCILGGPCP